MIFPFGIGSRCAIRRDIEKTLPGRGYAPKYVKSFNMYFFNAIKRMNFKCGMLVNETHACNTDLTKVTHACGVPEGGPPG